MHLILATPHVVASYYPHFTWSAQILTFTHLMIHRLAVIQAVEAQSQNTNVHGVIALILKTTLEI